jgi:hypothetical protein
MLWFVPEILARVKFHGEVVTIVMLHVHFLGPIFSVTGLVILSGEAVIDRISCKNLQYP